MLVAHKATRHRLTFVPHSAPLVRGIFATVQFEWPENGGGVSTASLTEVTVTESPPRRKRPTQADVARLAAVSQPVVSYVLSGNSDAPVAPETRERVLKAIAALG